MDIHLPKSIVFLVGFIAMLVALLMLVLMSVWRRRRKGYFSPFTENIFRLPGHSLRKEISTLSEDFTTQYIFFVFSAIGFLGSILIFNGSAQTVGIITACLFLGITIWKMMHQMNKLRNLILGCEGEEYTGQELSLLMRKGAFVFHDIPYKYGNIDHIICGNDRIFAVETKAVSKPLIKGQRSSSKEANVEFDGLQLKFPNTTTAEPIAQAKRHAKHLQEAIEKRLGFTYPVIPVVALPGWYIECNASDKKAVLVINPKRGKALNNWLGETKDNNKHHQVVNYLASVARSVSPRSRKTDPDANKHYNFWLNPRYNERLLGDNS